MLITSCSVSPPCVTGGLSVVLVSVHGSRLSLFAVQMPLLPAQCLFTALYLHFTLLNFDFLINILVLLSQTVCLGGTGGCQGLSE